MSVTRSTTLERGLVWLAALILAFGAMVPLASRMPVRAASPDLFFSEYIEGSSNNKAIEIFNGTGAPVNLSGYTLELYSNGSSVVTQTLAPSGTVADGDVYVIAHTLSNSLIQAQADLLTTAIVNFNGNDAVVLKHSGVAIDVFGQVGFDPGLPPGWGTSPDTTQDHTLTRKPTVHAGDAIGSDAFVPSVEWDFHPQDTSSFLGSHTVSDVPLPTNPTGVGAANPASVNVGATTVLTVSVTAGANPTSSGVTVTADLGPIGGAAAQGFADDGTTGGDATAGDLVFTYTATVGNVVVGDKVIIATIEDAEDRSNTANISLTVAGAPSEISDIQGTSHVSPMTGDDVFGVEGIVTATSGNGFWITDPTPDADPATSDGVFVFTSSRPGVAVGDGVLVSGTVAEFRPGGSASTNLTTTEIVSPTVDRISEDNDLPTSVIGVDRFPPTSVIDDDSTTSVEAASAVYDPANDGIDFWESLEGMRIEVRDAVAVGPTNGFGETAVVSELHTAAGPRTPRGGILVRQLGPAGDYRPGDFNPERVILDDALVVYPKVNTGDEFASDPVGVLDYNFGNYKLLVTASPGRVDNGLLPEVAAVVGSQELKVATFNVENLSTVDPQAKVDQLAAQIVTNLRAPDLIAIEEMQDNNGAATNNGVVAADQSWQRLIAAIAAAGGPVYQFRQIDPVNNADGGAPGGNIRVGFLFRTDRGLEFVDRPGGTATADTNVVSTANGKGAELTASPGRVLPDPSGPWATAFADTRKSLAGEFRWRGETVFVVVNHFSSKGDDRPLFGRFQPPFRLTEFESGTPEDGWRHAQAQVMNDFVDEILAVDPKANVIVLGDINDFDFSETVGVLSGARVALDPGPGMPDADGSGQTAATGAPVVLRTLFERLPANERYSYVFDGNSQVLDQILVSGSLWDLGTTYDVVHVNAEFFSQASDHDPSVMTVAFQPRRSQDSSGSGSSRGAPKGG